MNENKPNKPSNIASVSQGLSQGSVIGVQIGCLGAAVTIGALVIGLWLDSVLKTGPLFAIGLLVVSVPLSVFVIFRFALRAAKRLNERNDKPEDKSV